MKIPLLSDEQLEMWRFDAEDNDELMTAEAGRRLIATAIAARAECERLRAELLALAGGLVA